MSCSRCGRRPGRGSAPRLRVRRPAAEVGQRRGDPASGEVGGSLGDLLGCAPRDGADLPLLEPRVLHGRHRQHSAVEDQADGVVPAAPGREPVGEQELAGIEVEPELLLGLADRGELGRLADLDDAALAETCLKPAIDAANNCDADALLGDGGKPQACGWLIDRFGVRWQIVPKVLDGMMRDADRARAKRVADAMLKMVKLDVAALESAYRSGAA